ncbi:MAG: transporter substrate-binding domain-containing protein [Gammaproteobacteria bacterium]|nr:transporter substrate-binding domain-containing protein [Gammaproteobacteria bacterium]
MDLYTTNRGEFVMIIKKLVLTAATAAMMISSASSYAAQCTNDTWNKVMSSGKLIVGVKADYKPWAYRNSNGELVGMEIDMVKEVAATMGVKLELVPVQSSNRMQFLEQGKINMMIATMSDRPDRRKLVGITQPNYYTSGTNLLAPKALKLKNWEDLRGKPVCGKQGAFYNKNVSERYGANVSAFIGNAEAKQALRDKKCVGFVYDDSSIMADLVSGDWDNFEMPMPTEDDNPWGLAVPIAEKDCIFGQFMSGMTYNWHQSGKLIELEKKWGIQSTSYLKNQKERFADWIQ